jgi:hypothetical protein
MDKDEKYDEILTSSSWAEIVSFRISSIVLSEGGSLVLHMRQLFVLMLKGKFEI